MYVIIGGAFQGKLEYAKAQFGLSDSDIFECSEYSEPDFSKRCLDHIERYALYCIRNGIEPKVSMEQWLNRENAVLICEDIFCGVVPLDEEMRACREAAGRLLSYAAGKADGVVRMFCGLPQVLK